ncbi:V-set and immunoglobulin domain-containing protein 4 [Dryobates pubescens]|uniref:V-set and immunoglobulin domain-containing protein 4 n=1 Tax=Dryobates pubescens TaxID=118200 RepID=UPI0023B9DA82|nr:V-set and immunoglobulin domain-containing protein 4 [Dryobates pubescens]
MGMLVRAAVLMSPFLFCNAFLDLTGPSEIKGVWKGSATLPCAYVPVKDFEQQTLSWTVVHDQSSGTVIWRDGSGDHTFLSEYRNRVSVSKDTPGNVSLHILSLEISDRGSYTCQVTWRASNNSLIAREITTKLEVVKVAVTKPIIRAGELGLKVPAGASTSLTCEASGSPPIRYRWFRSILEGKALLLSSQAELAWDNLHPSDSGVYYCEAENKVGAGTVQRSDAVELTVTDPTTTPESFPRDVATSGTHHPATEESQTEFVFRHTSADSWTPWDSTTVTGLPITAVTSENAVGYPEKNYTSQDFQKTGLSLYMVILIAVICSAVVFLVISLIICLRKPKDAQVYEVVFRNSRATASSRFQSTSYYEEPITSTENNYVMEPTENKCGETNAQENKCDCAGNIQESEYEVGEAV